MKTALMLTGLAAALLCLPGASAAAQKAFKPDHLFVGDAPSRVVEFDEEGEFVKVLDEDTLAMAFGPDGLLYVANLQGIRALDADGHASKTFGEGDIPPGTLAGMCFATGGELCLIDNGVENRLLRFSVTQQDLVASPEVPSTVLSPLTLAPDGRLLGALAADVNGLPSHILQLLEFDVPDGQVSPPPEVLAQVACSVTFGPDGNQYFVQESGSQVSVRTPGGSDIALIGIDADLELPRDLRFGPDGHLYIASFGSGLVEVIDTTGAHVATIGADAPLDGPTRLAFSPRRFHAKLSGKSVGATGASVNLKADAVVSFTPGQATLMLLVENDLADQDDFASLYGGTLVFSGHQAAGEDPKTRRLAVACMSNVPLQAGFGVADLTLKGKLDEGGRFVPAKASGSFLRAAAGHVFTGKLSTGKLIK